MVSQLLLKGGVNVKPTQAVAAQKWQGIQGAITHNWRKFILLQAMPNKTKCHIATLLEALTLSKLKLYFKRKDGPVCAALPTC